MRRILWMFLFAFALLCTAHADTINALHVLYSFGPNFAGDNAEYILASKDLYLTGESSANCFPSNFCQGGIFFFPGERVKPDVHVDFEFSQGFVTVGGHLYYGPALFVTSINSSSFTFPLGGNVPSIFTVRVPASFALIAGITSDGTAFNIKIPPSVLVLKFDYSPARNGNPASYTFLSGRYQVGVVPEPGTLGLVATGLAAMAGLIRSRLA